MTNTVLGVRPLTRRLNTEPQRRWCCMSLLILLFPTRSLVHLKGVTLLETSLTEYTCTVKCCLIHRWLIWFTWLWRQFMLDFRYIFLLLLSSILSLCFDRCSTNKAGLDWMFTFEVIVLVVTQQATFSLGTEWLFSFSLQQKHWSPKWQHIRSKILPG